MWHAGCLFTNLAELSDGTTSGCEATALCTSILPLWNSIPPSCASIPAVTQLVRCCKRIICFIPFPSELPVSSVLRLSLFKTLTGHRDHVQTTSQVPLYAPSTCSEWINKSHRHSQVIDRTISCFPDSSDGITGKAVYHQVVIECSLFSYTYESMSPTGGFETVSRGRSGHKESKKLNNSNGPLMAATCRLHWKLKLSCCIWILRESSTHFFWWGFCDPPPPNYCCKAAHPHSGCVTVYQRLDSICLSSSNHCSVSHRYNQTPIEWRKALKPASVCLLKCVMKMNLLSASASQVSALDQFQVI